MKTLSIRDYHDSFLTVEAFCKTPLRVVIIPLILMLCALAGCSNNPSTKQHAQSVPANPQTIVTDDYELIIPEQQDALLILFPCFPCDAENTRTEFNIIDTAIAHNIAVLLMNFNQHVWLSKAEKEELEKTITNAARTHAINTENIYIGGFSSGGNVTLLLSNYLKSTGSTIQPQGLFIADSPIDLLALYETAQKTIKKNFSEPAVQEANWIIETFEAEFGRGDSAMLHYTKRSPYLSKIHSTHNISHLENLKIRLYSEPDTLWWKENRQAKYEDMNAYYIEQLAHDLATLYGKEKVNYIKTTNRGYRANGDRHPHSWSIIDETDLVKWMLSE